jgi:predicted TIM-barrel enzyme
MNTRKGPALRNNAVGAPTAVASGVSLDNVDEYHPFVDVFLVASSCQGVDFHELDEDKMRALAIKIHSFRAE